MHWLDSRSALAMIYAVAIFGGLGAVARYLLGVAFYEPHILFPWATWICNMLGVFLLVCLRNTQNHPFWSHSNIQRSVGTGFLGAFTTFSAISIETVELYFSGELLMLSLYLSSSFLFGWLVSYFAVFLFRQKRVDHGGTR